MATTFRLPRFSRREDRQRRQDRSNQVGVFGHRSSKRIDQLHHRRHDRHRRTEKSIDFTSEYYRSELVLVVKKEVATANPDRISAANFGTFIKGKQIESQNQTLTDDIIQKVFVTYGAIHNTAVDTFASAATDVVNGSAFAMTAEYPVALSIIASNSALGMVRLDQSILGDNLKDLGVSIGVKKGSALKADLSTVLEGISQDQRNSLMAGAVARSSGASL
jgi:putative lysine transport system substrate-binding protein